MSTSSPLGRLVRGWLPPLVVAAVVVFVYHRQTLLSGLDLVQSVENDSLFIGYVLEHWHRVLGGAVAWHSPQMYHPVPQTLGNSDVLLGLALPYHLLRFAGLDPFTSLNVTTALITLLTFASCYLLLRRFFGLSVLACCAGAAFFAMSHPRFTQQVHVQLQFLCLAPLTLWAALHVLRDGARTGPWRLLLVACAGGVSLALQLATAIYIAWFLVLLLALLLLLGLGARPFRRQLLVLLRARWHVLLGALVLTALLAWPVLQLYLRFPIRWSYEAIVQHIPTPLNLVSMTRESVVWGSLLDGLTPAGADTALGVGLVFGLAWLAAVLLAARWLAVRALRKPPAEERSGELDAVALAHLLLLASLLLVLIGLRYGERFSPWWLVYHAAPGAGGIRVVARLTLLLSLPVALAGAMGLDRCLALARARLGAWPARAAAGLVVAAFCLGLAEQAGTMMTYSGAARFARLAQLSKKVMPTCPAFLFKHAPLPESTQAGFSEEAYLEVNPDLQQQWRGSAWRHYDKRGRHQCRFVCDRAIWTAIRLHLEAMWVSALVGVPTLNGYSARHPEGWPFHNLACDGFDRGLKEWLARQAPLSRPCVVQVPLAVKSTTRERGR